MPNTTKAFTLISALLLLISSLFTVVCSENNDDDEITTESFTPLNCTIPGELQLSDDTKGILNKYQR
ncbi:MAG TPA: hypothetical protein ENI84_00760 [Thiothrix sp.]|nr:hypothetical protein [Thiothrix sp.]